MLGECRRVFANSGNTAARAARFNGLAGRAAVPSAAARRRGCTAARPATTCSRSAGSKSVKRVDLGDPRHGPRAARPVARRRRHRHAARRARGAGRVARTRPTACASSARSSDDELIELYAGALGVIFPPYDEDYGYVTLEAFLAHKPVITTTDAGGPNEFVDRRRERLRHARPMPEALGAAIARLARRSRARRGAWATPATSARARSPGTASSSGWSAERHDEAHHPDSLPQRGRDAAGDAGRSARDRCRASTSSRSLVIDDGSRDDTADGRARARRRITSSASAGARAWPRRSWPASTRPASSAPTIIVNTDADNQYAGTRHRRGWSRRSSTASADIVIGDRNIRDLQHMSWPKKLLQRLGSWVVRQVSGTAVPDTTSGFRAYTREAALRMTIVSEFSYTLESIIQAGKKRMAIAHVEVAHQPAHAAVAAVRQHVLVHQAVGARRSSASTRCTSR